MSARLATYLDSNASSPLQPRVAEALAFLLKDNGALLANPSSTHSSGKKARRLVSEARDHVALSLGKSTVPDDLIFTSSGTEANQLAIRSALEPRLDSGERPHWILSAVEHESTRAMVRWLTERGGSVSFIPVDSEGRLELTELRKLWRPETALVSCVWVNNETGVVSDVAALASEARALRVPLHLDAAQTWGKLPVDVAASGAAYVSVSAHKIGALAGTGVLWVARGAAFRPLLAGEQEKSRRGGTENLLGLVALGEAVLGLSPTSWAAATCVLRDQLEASARARIPGVVINGAGAPRVANTSSLSFEGVEKEGLVAALDLAGYSVSSGAACSSGTAKPSATLVAMGRSEAQARSAVRVSLPGPDVSSAALQGFVEALATAVQKMRDSKRML